MVKVIHVISDHNFGGAGQYLMSILKYSNRQEFDVQVICHGKGQLYHKLVKETNIKIHLASETIGPKSFDPKLFIKILKILNNEKPQILHVHASLAGRLAAKLLGIKIVMTKHWKQNPGNRQLIKLMSKGLTNKIIAISDAVAVSLVKAGVPDKFIKVIHNGIDVESFQSLSEVDMREELKIKTPIVIGMVARLEAEKDHKTFLKAAKLVLDNTRDVTFIVAGKGSMESELKEYGRELKIDKNVIFTGFVENINELINILDISVLTSVNEAFGLVLAEGMILEKPIVATSLDSIQEVVGEAGLYFTPGDAEGLANKMLKLITNDDMRLQLGKQGKDRVLKFFDSRVMVKKLEDTYRVL
ncbi:glycosyltransferase [Alkaliphilus peptidifermentans]|uniref:Glycosyltransferase involved in cell wall bisynthesis n=1 Tax=Alkaliphilus peptidifermentans DSM 18978 TaxID=1120976 RepID=A0A1G5GCQ9_9FIRM|nr:glycosyltransferase [Alkaliphilus peptidifermentans]SCY49141.1 Glycosyltransferase involved in cell wall bisynthesis [Alkaliphilus peptidifermentans DSM 18978]